MGNKLSTKQMAVVEQIFPSLTWRIRHTVMYPDQSYDSVKLVNDFEGIHFGIYANHELTGVVSLFINGKEAQFRKLAILQEAQHQGLGTQLMEYLMDFCKVQQLEKLWCNARINAKDFYLRLGFHETNATYSANGYDYMRMEIELSYE